jgi:hypothetical protein
MKYTDIAIIGGGLAGSTTAAMLGRAGIAAVLIDPHDIYPFDFRVEKLNGDAQLERFSRTGIADSVLRSATHEGENWIARFGYLLDKRPSRQFGISYENRISAIRAEIPHPAALVYAKVNGLNVGLRRSFGIDRQITSACHSISIGFDLVPVGRSAFDFPAMSCFSERTSDRIPYLTLFPVGSAMRANLFTYREILRRLVVGAVVRFSQGHDRQRPLLAGPALGRFLVWLSQGTLRRASNHLSDASKLRPRAAAASSMSPSA